MTWASYILCATPRSGSTLLCDLLADTGVAGRPASFWRRESIPCWAERLNVPGAEVSAGPAFDAAYLAAVLHKGTGDTGVFGLRLMWESLEELLARLAELYPDASDDSVLLDSALGTTLYVHLSREDKIAQAISLLKAHQTGLWHRAVDGSERERTASLGAPIYDGNRIDALVRTLAADDRAWTEWFVRHGITPLRVRYEDLAAEPRAVLAKLLSALGKDPTIAAAITPRTAKIADSENLDWAALYRSGKDKAP